MTVNIIMDDLRDGTCVDKSFDQVIFCGLKNNCPEYPPTLSLLEEESSDDGTNWLLWIGIVVAGLFPSLLSLLLLSKQVSKKEILNTNRVYRNVNRIDDCCEICLKIIWNLVKI